MKLDGCVTYLAGPIDRVKDCGMSWRIVLTNMIREAGLSLVIFDPTREILGVKASESDLRNTLENIRLQGNYDEYSRLIEKIIHVDLRLVDLSDFIIAKIDPEIFMCGTVHEIVMASLQKKPVLLIVNGGKQNCPGWLFGLLDHRLIFDSERSLVDYLVAVDCGQVEVGERWLFVRHEMQRLLEESCAVYKTRR